MVRATRRLRQSELSEPTINCYPPAVNYTPLYYLINGVAFDKTNASTSLFPATPGTAAAPVDGNCIGAPGECRPAHARPVDRRPPDRVARSLQASD